MGRAKGNLIKEFATLSWKESVVFGMGGFFAIRYVLPMFVKGNQFAPIVAAFYVPMSWFVLVAGIIGAVMSWVGQQHRRKLIDAQQGLESIAALGWRHFEQLVGEAFRRQGYTVEETGLGGADGGIDLILRKNGRRALVQCKQWRRRQIAVNIVREMYGLLAHHGADEVKIACSGTYTRGAASFAKDKPIELIGGEELLRMVRGVQTAPTQATRAVEVVNLHQLSRRPRSRPLVRSAERRWSNEAIATLGKSFGDVRRFRLAEACGECKKCILNPVSNRFSSTASARD